MPRNKYINNLKTKLRRWGALLAILEDDIERVPEKNREDYVITFENLMRQFEEVESRIAGLEVTATEEFQSEKVHIEEEMENFEEELERARDEIPDV